mmetsp:Transcript_5401/g.7798  ORF Transcript_5401/g.7798 Transcript_5401/m.7798 type:complete len:148 (+) Transcript_5401:176-619(+)
MQSLVRAVSRIALVHRGVAPSVANVTMSLNQPNNSNQIRFRSNRSRRGLYDGKDIRSGNNVSHSERKTKRKFKPNVFRKRVYSETLDEMIRFNLTAAALRSIDKAGGLDNYLLKSKHVTEGQGLVAKNRILERMKELEENNTKDPIL